MPLYCNQLLGHDLLPGTNAPPANFERYGACLNIGVVNNMPDGALQSTERQFINLLGSAADAIDVRLTFYGLPDIPRSNWGRNRVRALYSTVEELWQQRL